MVNDGEVFEDVSTSILTNLPLCNIENFTFAKCALSFVAQSNSRTLSILWLSASECNAQ